MASPIQTRGFEVSVMPNVQLADPRMFDPYSGIVNGLAAGTNIAGGLQNIMLNRQRQNLADAQEARAAEMAAYNQSRRPIQEQLQNMQIEEGQLGLTSLRATVPRKVAEAQMPIENQTGTFIDIDDDGNEVQYGNIQFVDPVTKEKGTYTGRPLKTLRTAAQIAADAERAAVANESSRALAAQRGTIKDPYGYAVAELEQAQAEGDAKGVEYWSARIKRLNAQPGILVPGTVADREIEKLSVDASVTLGQAQVLAQTQEGLSAMQKLAAIKSFTAKNGVPPAMIKLTPEEQAVLNSSKQAATNPAAPAARPMPRPAAAAAPKPAARTFATVADAEAAAAAGLIRPGDEISVAGQLGQWQ